MRFGRLATGPVLGLTLLSAMPMAAQDSFAVREEPLESRIWLDRGTSPVLRRGDLVRVFYRASRDAYVSIFHIDTNGFARLLHPGSPTDGHLALGGRDYRVLFPESRYWQVEEDEGKGYLFMVASPAPLDFSGFAYSRYGGGWNLAAVAQAAYRDPFLMMDDVVATLIPERGGEYAVDFVAYDIDRPHDYPRFLCYQCHGFRPMFDWNPYGHWCTDFRVVIHDDPYYYPVYRYSGDRVVYTRPPEPPRPMFEFRERADGEGATPLIQTRSGDAPGRGIGRGLGQESGGAPTARGSRPARADAAAGGRRGRGGRSGGRAGAAGEGCAAARGGGAVGLCGAGRGRPRARARRGASGWDGRRAGGAGRRDLPAARRAAPRRGRSRRAVAAGYGSVSGRRCRRRPR